jgi:hypothetical protein
MLFIDVALDGVNTAPGMTHAIAVLSNESDSVIGG